MFWNPHVISFPMAMYTETLLSQKMIGKIEFEETCPTLKDFLGPEGDC